MDIGKEDDRPIHIEKPTRETTTPDRTPSIPTEVPSTPDPAKVPVER